MIGLTVPSAPGLRSHFSVMWKNNLLFVSPSIRRPTVWLKKNKKADSWFYGLGFWTRGNAEICLLATRGHPKRKAANIHQFIISPIEAHSKKPDEAREKIVALMGDLPRVELFARQSPPGWEVWGNEVKSTIPDFGTKCPEVKGAGKEADPCPM